MNRTSAFPPAIASKSCVLALLFVITLWSGLRAQQGAPGNGPFAENVRGGIHPHLVVVISIDQFRADYLRRYADLLMPAFDAAHSTVGGFQYLMGGGSYFVDARYAHFPLTTGPGHSVILTGGYPYKTGIVANDWWDRRAHAVMYCVSDSTVKPVGDSGTHARPMGPRNLHSTTVGDELKLATAMHAKVATISLKDRAAILLGGRLQDISLWFDAEMGRWISSTAYCRDGRLPAWVTAINNEKFPASRVGMQWELSVPPSVAASRTRPVNMQVHAGFDPGGIGPAFPHRIKSIGGFTLTPWANDYVLTSALRTVDELGMGRDNVPDLLAINLASNDYVGHAFGPYSPEALDITLRTDSALATFFNGLRGRFASGLDSVVIVITADHGVAPDPRDGKQLGLPAGLVPDALITRAADSVLASVNDKLAGALAAGRHVCGFFESYLYLDDDAVAGALGSHHELSRAGIEDMVADAVARIPNVYACYARNRIMSGSLPANDVAGRITRGFHPAVSGDVVVITDPMYLTSDQVSDSTRISTSHGMPFAYDYHVPILIAGPGIRTGVWATPVSPADIAPTLCTLLGIEYPSACDGVILQDAVR